MSLTPQAERYLEALADDLAISETRYEQAETSYKAFGAWLHRPASTVKAFQPHVYVQGSFALGTVIKPISEEEDYDVDIVSQFNGLTTGTQSQKRLKDLLKVEVYSYHHANSMTKPIREGRRCWVLNYSDGAQFHMDIVPAVPDALRLRRLLEQAGRTNAWSDSAVAITDNERWNYEVIDPDWCRSNPRGYLAWFRGRMVTQFEARRRMLAESVRMKVDDIPDYRVRTPLQSAIMILKRHRDWCFAADPVNKPISIIITTLAAHAYQSEGTIGQALMSILQRMDSFIEAEHGRWVIRNPTDPLENFADKWAEFPERAQAFFAWLKRAREDFDYASRQTDPALIMEGVAPRVGRSAAERARNRVQGGGGLLRSVAPVGGSGLAFPDQRRVPTDQQGFA